MGSLLSLSRPFSLSLFRRSLPSFSFSFSSLSLFSPLSVTMTMITRPVGSLCVHKALTCLMNVCVRGLRSIPCLAKMFTLKARNNMSWYHCASLVPLGMKWACICAGNGCCVWLCGSMCLHVLTCVIFCDFVLVCDSMC